MLVTFGSENLKRTETRNTKLHIVLKVGSIMTINANVIPQIAESIQRRPVNLKSLDKWECLWNEFSLADDLPSERETSSIDLLTGNDYYPDIILPQKMKSNHAYTCLDPSRAGFYQGEQMKPLKTQQNRICSF